MPSNAMALPNLMRTHVRGNQGRHARQRWSRCRCAPGKVFAVTIGTQRGATPEERVGYRGYCMRSTNGAKLWSQPQGQCRQHRFKRAFGPLGCGPSVREQLLDSESLHAMRSEFPAQVSAAQAGGGDALLSWFGRHYDARNWQVVLQIAGVGALCAAVLVWLVVLDDRTLTPWAGRRAPCARAPVPSSSASCAGIRRT